MCGICGYIGKRRISYSDLERCNEAMVCRGPDDAGTIIFEEAEQIVALAHRRLSIIDVSSAGHQPMTSVDKNIVIVFNGEIYNYLELKKELSYPYRSHTDTEVIIAAYLKWGIDCLSHLNGMFALAIYDRRLHKLFLARDKMGKKPLYCYQKGSEFFFASTMEAIMRYPFFNSEIDQQSVRRLLTRAYIVSPYTIFQDVKKIEPGEVWEINSNSYKRIHYWNLLENYDSLNNVFAGDYRDAKDELKYYLTQSIKNRLHADVPVGVLLSGGIDSTLVAAIASRVSNSPIHTYTIGFYDKTYNEAEFAKQVANIIGSQHHEMYIDESNLLNMLDYIQDAYDEPFADSSQVAMMAVARMAKESNVKVLLSGDGGDELFCGYPLYADERIAQKIDWIGAIINGVFGEEWERRLPFYVRAISQNRDKRYKTQFNLLGYRSVVDKMLPGECVLYDESLIHEKNWARKKMLLDQKSFLPDDNLCKVDRASMHYSIEVRSPLLDDNLVNLSHSLKYSYLCKGKSTKRILRDILYEYVPKEVMERPKMGFSIPTDSWLKGGLREELTTYSRADYLKMQGIFVPDITERIVDNWLDTKKPAPRGRNYKEIIWAFYMFQKWYQKYIKQG